MADLSHLSDDQLRSIVNGSGSAPSTAGPDLSHLSDDDLAKISNIDSGQSFGQSALNAISTGAKALDSVTGAPVRSAISAYQNGLSPWQAAKNQFANMSDEAPSGKDIAANAGLSREPSSPRLAASENSYTGPMSDRMAMMQLGAGSSHAGVVGQGIDIAANPLNLTGPILKIVGKVGEAAAPLADVLHDFSVDRALKAAGAMKRDFNMIQSKGMQDSLGTFLLDKKLVTPTSTLSKIADKISEAKQAAGESIGSILDTADASGAPPISAKDIALKLSEDPEIKQLASIPGKEGTSHQINKFIETLYNHPGGDNLTLRDAQQLRQGIDSSINFNKRVPEMAGAQPYLFKMRDAISNAMNDSVNALEDGGELNKLKTANASYSKLATLDKIAQDRLGALSSNEKLSLGDKVAAGVGAVAGHGNPFIAGAAAIFNKGARAVGNSLSATGANAASKLISSGAEAFPKVPLVSGPVLSAVNSNVIPAVETFQRAAQSAPQMPQPARNPAQGFSDGGTVPPPSPNDVYKGFMSQSGSSGAANAIKNAWSTLTGKYEGGTVPNPSPAPWWSPSSSSIAINIARAGQGKAHGGVVDAPIDSPQKDVTLIKATPGEVVLPLSVTQSPNAPQKAKEFMANEQFKQQMLPQQGQAPQQMPQPQIQPQPTPKPILASKGPEKWASDGFQNLKGHVNDEDRALLEEHKAKLMLDPKAQKLLITASQFSPGAKPLDDIIKHLKNRIDAKK